MPAGLVAFFTVRLPVSRVFVNAAVCAPVLLIMPLITPFAGVTVMSATVVSVTVYVASAGSLSSDIVSVSASSNVSVFPPSLIVTPSFVQPSATASFSSTLNVYFVL